MTVMERVEEDKEVRDEGFTGGTKGERERSEVRE